MGFRLEKTVDLREIHSEAYLFSHHKGLQLIHIKNEDTNKVASISLKTAVANHLGLAHLVEHTVFCGSKKYPIKDTFSALLKNSLYTYLNAITFNDKTVYAFGSYNEKAFLNMFNIYADAIYFPQIFEKEAAFLLEKNVVYHEMLGFFSDPVEILKAASFQQLFKTHTSGFVAAGLPSEIAGIQYKDFLDFHRDYYQPNNSYIYLYGDLNIEPYLDLLNENLRELSTTSIRSGKKINSANEIDSGFTTHKTGEENIMAVGYVIRPDEIKTRLQFKILVELLFNDEHGLLKKQLLPESIGDEISCDFQSERNPSVFFILVKNPKISEEGFRVLINKTLNESIDGDTLNSLIPGSLHKIEFSLQEEKQGYKPKGLLYGLDILNTWMYDQDPFACFSTLHIFEGIKKEIKGESKKYYFQELIKKHLIENEEFSILSLASIQGKASPSIKVVHSEHDLKLIREYENVKDDKKILHKINIVSASDVDIQMKSNFNLYELNGIEILRHTVKSNRIIYLDVIYNTACVPVESLSYIAVAACVLNRLKKADSCFGLFNTEFKLFTVEGPNEYRPRLIIRTGFFAEDMEAALNEIFRITSEIEISEKEWLKNILTEKLYDLRTDIIQTNDYAPACAGSYLQDGLAYSYKIQGLGFYYFLEELLKNFDEDFERVGEKITEVGKLLFDNESPVISIGCEGETFIEKEQLLKDFCLRVFKKENKVKATIHFPKVKASIHSYDFHLSTQNVAQAFDFQSSSLNTGSFKVFEKMLNSGYLWTELRTKYGCYDTKCGFLGKNIFYLSTFRDPNISETLEAFRKIPNYVRKQQVEPEELQAIIMGTLNEVLRPKKILESIDFNIENYFSERTESCLQNEREQIIKTEDKDILRCVEILERNMDTGSICIIGGKAKEKE